MAYRPFVVYSTIILYFIWMYFFAMLYVYTAEFRSIYHRPLVLPWIHYINEVKLHNMSNWYSNLNLLDLKILCLCMYVALNSKVSVQKLMEIGDENPFANLWLVILAYSWVYSMFHNKLTCNYRAIKLLNYIINSGQEFWQVFHIKPT